MEKRGILITEVVGGQAIWLDDLGSGHYSGARQPAGRLKGRRTQLAAVSTFRYALRRVFGNPLVIILAVAAAFCGTYKFADEWIQKLKELMEKKQ